MSPVARALEERFDEVCRAEIARLTRKTGGLAPDERVAVQDLTFQVVHAIAARAGASLGKPDGEDLAPVLARLFDVKEAIHESCDGGGRCGDHRGLCGSGACGAEA